MGTLANSQDPDEISFRHFGISSGSALFAKSSFHAGTEMHHNLKIPICDPLKYIMDDPTLIVSFCVGVSISTQRDKNEPSVICCHKNEEIKL